MCIRDSPPSIEEALVWKKHVNASIKNIDEFIFVHGHIHLPRDEKMVI